MAVILTVTSTPSTFTSGNFPLSTMNLGTWRFTATMSLISSNATYANFQSLFSTNDNGGVWQNTRRIEIYDQSAGSLMVQSAVLTWSASQAITITIVLAVGTNASSLTIAGATTGNGTTTFTKGSNTVFTASTLGVGAFTGNNTFLYAGTISSVDDTAPASASGTAAVAGITSSGTAIPGTFASGTPAVAGITGSGVATSPGIASGTAAVGGITSVAQAASPALASGTPDVGGITGTGSASTFTYGSIGESSATQRADQTGTLTGTMSTAYSARTPSAAVGANDLLAFNGHRWIVHTAGTLSSGSGPSTTGQQTDGTASLVAMTSTDQALTMTTQSSKSVMLACLMRDQWTKDTSAPTDNKSNTYTIQGSAHFYSGFPTAASAVFAKLGATGGSGHTVSASWGGDLNNVHGAEASMLVVEIPTSRSNPIIQDISFVERVTTGTVSSASVTTTGPAILVGYWLGTGGIVTIGTSHPGAPQSPMTLLPNANTMIAIHNNGYIQGMAAWCFKVDPGTYTATWTGTAEGAQFYLVAIQEAPGTLASGTAAVAGITSSGVAGPAASGSANVAGVTSSGVANSGATGSPNVGGVTSSGVANPAASGSPSVGGVSSTGAANPSASGAASSGGITSSGTSAVAASGSPSVAGITSSGTAAPSPSASGSPGVGGITSSGVAAIVAFGSASPGGVTSSGAAVPGTYATGTAATGGITSSGSAVPGTYANGTAAVGGVTSTGGALSPGTALGSTTVGGISCAGTAATTAAGNASGNASAGGITCAGTATTAAASGASGNASTGGITCTGSAVGPAAHGTLAVTLGSLTCTATVNQVGVNSSASVQIRIHQDSAVTIERRPTEATSGAVGLRVRGT